MHAPADACDGFLCADLFQSVNRAEGSLLRFDHLVGGAESGVSTDAPPPLHRHLFGRETAQKASPPPVLAQTGGKWRGNGQNMTRDSPKDPFPSLGKGGVKIVGRSSNLLPGERNERRG